MPAKEQVIAVIIAVIIILVFLGLLFVFMLIYYRNRKKQMNTEKENMRLLFQQQLLSVKLETQEQTMSALSRDLHDNIGQLLGSAKMQLNLAHRKPDGDSLQLAEQTLADAIAELRSLSKTMSPEWLQQFNFFDNLSTEVKRMNAGGKHQLSVDSNVDILQLSHEKQIIVFRIVQEAINNAVKHGNAEHICIKATSDAHHFKLIVSDNGRGLPAAHTDGLGMLNMKQRTELLNGTINWRSQAGKTEMTLVIPLNALA